MQNQGVLVQSRLELRASENARRETIPMRGLLRRVRRSRPRSQAKAPLWNWLGLPPCAGDAIRGQ